MSSITVIGTGSIGTAVAVIAANAGATIQIMGRNQEKVATLAHQVGGTVAAVGDTLTGDIIVLALPYTAVTELVDTYGGQFNGKTLVDVSNPVDFSTFDSLTVPADSSGAAELQAKVPGAKVLKAFNTNFATTLATGKTGDAPVTVLVAGDDADAKQELIELVVSGGLAAIGVGSLKRSRELEALGFLQLTLAAQELVSWSGGFAVQN